MDIKTLIDWLTPFVEALKNPAFLIFFCSSVVGYVIKNIELADPIPNWLIPAILSFIGALCGWTFLFASASWANVFAVGIVGHFQAAIAGMTISLSSVGVHQIYYQLKNRKKQETPQKPV